MSYLRFDGGELRGDRLGCGRSCGCGACRAEARRLGESYFEPEVDEDDDDDRETDDEDPDSTDDDRRESKNDASDPERGNRRGAHRVGRRRARRGARRVRRPGGRLSGGWFGEAPCASPGGVANTNPKEGRCRTTPQRCLPIANLMCVREVAGVPFVAIRGGVMRAVEQRFTPAIGERLARFIALMRQSALPIEAIFTMGALVCRCQTATDRLSEHALGTAIDISGVRWSAPFPSGARGDRTMVIDFQSDPDLRLLRRINACLRLAFPQVLDYLYNEAHQNHFHCDSNRGRPRSHGHATAGFVQDALGALGHRVPFTRNFDQPTLDAVAAVAVVPASSLGGPGALDRERLDAALDRLFTITASGGSGTAARVSPIASAVSTVATAAAAAPRGATSAVSAAADARLVRDSIASGVRDERQITNRVFFAHHPEMKGRRIRPDERALAAEWIRIRNQLVRPALAVEDGGRVPR